jgi:hypothetical protein
LTAFLNEMTPKNGRYLFKGKIYFMSIQMYNPLGAYIVIVSRYPVTVMCLVLAVPVYWIAGGHVGAFVHQPIRQDNQGNFEKKPRSPIQIRPPPL